MTGPPSVRVQRQWLFSESVGQWLSWVKARGWKVTFSEGYVGDTDGADGDHDGPHLGDGGHYSRTAGDFNLWVPDKKTGEFRLISEGGTPYWREAGGVWKSLHPLCIWGGDFPKRDDNHLSIKTPGVRP